MMHRLQIKFDGDAGSLVINGTEYFLHQLHWHSPSEHTVNGRRYDMEMHLVHQSADDKAAVISVLYRVGRPDGLLRKLEPFLRLIGDQRDREERIGVVHPHAARGRASVYYRYMGSLTTPPCTEGVIWTILRRVRTVSKHQLELLREAVHDVSLAPHPGFPHTPRLLVSHPLPSALLIHDGRESLPDACTKPR
jgi:carbonic anhydrase